MVEQAGLIAQALETVRIDQRNLRFRDAKLLAHPVADAHSQSERIGMPFHPLEQRYAQRPVGRRTAALLAMVGVRGREIIFVKLPLHRFVEAAQQRPDQGQVFHADGQEFGLVVADTCLTERLEEVPDPLVRQERREDGLHERRFGQNPAFPAQPHSFQPLLDRCRIRFEDLPQGRRHHRHAGIELHTSLQLFEQFEHRNAVCLHLQMPCACL